uniref:Uncharacterized protein n=1 Tax=Anguilla anguilla TaxID=7936 RepID=A0A0E9PRX0_ANGAN
MTPCGIPPIIPSIHNIVNTAVLRMKRCSVRKSG